MTHEEQQEMIRRLKGKRAGYVLLNKRGMVNAEKELIEEADKIKKKIETKNKIIETFIDETEDKTPCDCIMQGLKETEDGWELDPRTIWAVKNAPDEVLYETDGKPYSLNPRMVKLKHLYMDMFIQILQKVKQYIELTQNQIGNQREVRLLTLLIQKL